MCPSATGGRLTVMTDIVRTTGLTRRYGDRTVVDGVDLRIPEGTVYGFLGPNGSGKSTTMKMLLSLVTPTSGEVEIMGQPMTRSTRHRLLGEIGSLIEAPPGYGHITGGENMRIVQRLVGAEDRDIALAVDTVRLRGQMDKKVRDYSLGMKQRLGIAMALARRPRLLILDEPTNGLDPAGIEEMRALLTGLADRGVTVMVSSHLLDEIDRTATRIGILDSGRLIFQGARADLVAATTPDLLIDVAGGTADVEKLPAWAGRLDGNRLRLADVAEKDVPRVVAELVHAGVGITRINRETQSLEDVFRELTGAGGLR